MKEIEMNGTNGTDGTNGTVAPPVANRPGAKVEEILALVKLAQKTEDAEELRGILAGAKALCRHAIHRARYKAKHKAGTVGTEGTMGNPPFSTPNPIVEAAMAFLDALEKGEAHE